MKSKAIGALALLLTASTPAMALEGADVYSQVRSSLVQLVGVGVEGRFYLVHEQGGLRSRQESARGGPKPSEAESAE